MPIGFADLLQTNAQYVNGLNKGIVSTDDVYGGVRSKIDDWTAFHLSTKTNDNGVTYRTFQDDGTAAAPGQFKAYSTILYVADGRPLIQDNDALAGTYIELDGNGDFTTAGNGTRFVAQAGDAEPAYYVLTDATQIGGTGTGTDKLPSFTISGNIGTETGTAVPAGYTKLSSVDSTIGTGGFTSWTIQADDTNTEAITDGLTVDFTGGTGISTTYNTSTNTLAISLGSVTSSELATAVSDETGDGLLVFNNGPTLIAPALGTPVSGDLSNCTFPVLNQDTSGNALTATTATHLAGGATGSIVYQSGSGATAFLAGNAAASNLFLKSTGTGGAAQAPSFAAISTSDVSGLGTIATQNATTVNIDGGAIDGTAIGGTTPSTGAFTTITASSNVTISGNLTVSGNFVQANSTVVDFEDAVLALGVPRNSSNVIEDATSTTDTGLNFVKTTAGNAITEFAAFRYDISDDKFKFTQWGTLDGLLDGTEQQGDPPNGSWTESDVIAYADNVATLKFTVTDTNTQVDQNGTADAMAAGDEANAQSVRSLGAIAKCTIDITSETTNGGTSDNYAPEAKAAGGYPIKHNLVTQSVVVHAIQTHNASAQALADPISIFCKYIPEDDNTVRVFLPRAQENEKYDIIVIG